MANRRGTKKREWTSEEYSAEAAEWVACYGPNYCWDEFIYEYIQGWDSDTQAAPDGDRMYSAIKAAGG
jgi:hypothetical protein